MLDILLAPDTLVLLAGLFYVVGYLVTNQIWLRMLILIGTVFYLIYYWTVADSPLWAAIYMSLGICVANIIGTCSLLIGRSRLMIPSADKALHNRFPGIEPGDFAAVMRQANRRVLMADLRATEQGKPGAMLYYVVSGTTRIEKSGDRFLVPPGVFIGEVAYMTGGPSSATSWIPEGAEILEWSFDALHKRSRRKSRFKLALEAMISMDLAAKVSRAVAPTSDEWRPDQMPAAAGS